MAQNIEKQAKQPEPHISVAPMMDWTDRHCRYFHRLISPNSWLYTEMVTTGALLHGDKERFLRYSPQEHPIALQLGGASPQQLAECCKMAEDFGYDEINLNCGCPSDRVQSGMFGACLMKKPDHVAACIAAMIEATHTPITVKCRMGVDEQDDFEFLDTFVKTIAQTGCKTFIIHARKAWLKGLSPKQNREVPPLDYNRVYKIKEKYPELRIILNGGVTNIQTIKEALKKCDGVMIGREAYQNSYFLAEIEKEIFQTDAIPNREDIARAMIAYAHDQAQKHQTPIKSVTRHMMGLFHQQTGAKNWRRSLSTLPYEEDTAVPELIEQALAARGHT